MKHLHIDPNSFGGHGTGQIHLEDKYQERLQACRRRLQQKKKTIEGNSAPQPLLFLHAASVTVPAHPGLVSSAK
jgi:hypothetical protein